MSAATSSTTSPAPATAVLPPVRPRSFTGSVLGTGAIGPVPPPDAGTPAGVAASARPVPEWFDQAAVLGRRGYKYLPAVSQLSLAAGRAALSGVDLLDVPGSARSLWVGTSAAPVGIHAPLDATIREDGADLLSPIGAPFFSVNLAAGRLSSELLSHARATTYTTPATAGIDALAGALRALDPSRPAPDRVAVALAVEVTPPGGEYGADAPEAGAVALALGPPGVPGTVQLSVRRGSWAPGTVQTDLLALVDGLPDGLDDASGTQPAPDVDVPGRGTLHLLASPDARAALATGGVLTRALRADVTIGAGAYVPLAAVLAAAGGPGPSVLLVAGPDGRAAAVLVRPPAAAGTNGAAGPSAGPDGSQGATA